jgi:hypothetical protein
LQQTVTASTMITDLECGDKVGCHMGVVENVDHPTALEIGEHPWTAPFG